MPSAATLQRLTIPPAPTQQEIAITSTLRRPLSPEFGLLSPISVTSSLPSPLSKQQPQQKQALSGSVKVDDVLSTLISLCLCIGVVQSKIKNGGRILSKVETIKDEFTARKHDLVRFDATPSIQKWLLEVQQTATVLETKSKSTTSSSFTTPDGRRKKVEKKLNELIHAWNELMMNLTLLIAGQSSVVATEANGNVAKLAIASGHPDWEVMDEQSAIKISIQGDKYLFGYGVGKSYDMAFKRYMAAAKFGHVEACNMLGTMYEFGLGRDPDLPTAIFWYKSAASKNYPEAMNNLGRIYETGKGLPKDLTTAIEFYVKAAELGNADAQTNLGCVLENGIGCIPDAKKALSWYQLAAEQNDYARAQNCIGSLYFSGKPGIQRDYQEAVKWFRKASEQGNGHAQNNLGICYEEGLGVVRDYAMAKECYQKASATYHPSGTNNLGYIYLLEKKYDDAIRTFYLAAALGSVDALYNLGTVYEAGVSHPDEAPDDALATKYYLEAAEKGYEKAQLKVGEMYLNGTQTITKNVEEAFKWYERCSQTENAEACNRLGQLYELGIGTAGGVPNLDEARKFYHKAGSKGHVGAMANLGALYELGLGVEKNIEKAITLYVEADKKGSLDARQRLQELRAFVDAANNHFE